MSRYRIACWSSCESLERRVLLSLSPLGLEFPVNTITANAQHAPAVASDAVGNTVVVWQGNGTGDALGIFARRFGSAGQALSQQFLVNTTTSGTQNMPAVEMDADGDFVVAWAGSGPGDTGGIFAKRYNAAGIAQGGEFRVNTFTSNIQRFPAVAMDGVGNFVIAWGSLGQDGGTGESIYAQRYNAAGVAQGGEFRVNTTTSGNQGFPSIATDADGDFVVAWAGNGPGDTGGVFAQRYDSPGSPQGGEFLVNTLTTGTQAGAAVAMDDAGNFVIAWMSDPADGGSNLDIYARRFDVAGVPHGEEFWVNTTTGGVQFLPRAAMDANGDFLLVWDSIGQDGSNSGVYGQSFNGAGVPLGDEFRVNSYTTNAQSVPAVAMDAEGDAVVVWQSDLQDGSGYGVYAQRYAVPVPISGPLANNNDGATGTSGYTHTNPSVVAYDDNVLVAFNDSLDVGGFSSSSDGGATFFDRGPLYGAAPSLARDDLTGRVYLVAQGEFGGREVGVFRSDDNGRSWSPPTGVSNEVDLVSAPHLAVDNFAGTGRGNVYVVFQKRNDPELIRFHRSTDGGQNFTFPGLNLTGDSSAVNMPRVVVGPDHAVYVFWFDLGGLMMRKSIDLGVSFGSAITVATGLPFTGDLGLTGIRRGTTTEISFQSNSMPHVAVNPVSGHLYVAINKDAAGADRADIFLVQSTDGGTTWSAPVRVNDDATVTDQWNPTIAVSRDGSRVGVFYYSRQEDPLNNEYRMYGRIAVVSGASLTFGPAFPVSDVPSLPEFGRDETIQNFPLPETLNYYNSSYASEDAFHIVWTDSRDDLPGGGNRKDPNIYHRQISIGVAPSVTASSFLPETAPHGLRFTFDNDVSTSLGTSDIVLENLTTQQTIQGSQLTLSYDGTTETATIRYTGNDGGIAGVLPDGSYRATLLASGIAALDGTPMTTDHIFTFLFLNGDANSDGRVNLSDFNILAANFGQSNRTYSQADFTYDGVVNLADFNILASRFGVALGVAGGGALREFAADDVDGRGDDADDESPPEN